MDKYACCSFKIGKIKICEEDGKITAVFPAEENAEIVFPKTDLLKEAVLQLEDYFCGKRKIFSLPLKLKGTPFQIKVWQQLLKIPYGETRSYSEIDESIGNKKACRAVGAAVGKNPVFIIAACHRVVGKDGSLTGFAYGLDIKEKLLKAENAI